MADRHVRIPRLGKAIPPIGSDFVSLEAASGIVLLLATVAALLWANAATASYHDWWHHELTIGFGDAALTEDLAHWVNDGLMAVFFFVVGLEIKRELVVGELRDPRTAALPAVAALGGMVVPALLYVVINLGAGGALDGWAVPMATDIAFAVGVLAILGSRVPGPLKLFMLTLAIVDDVGAIVVIALFYSKGIDVAWLAGAAASLVVVHLMSRWGANRALMYVLPALLLWVCVFESGVHATLAGVVLGLMTPARPRGGRPVLERLERGLHPLSSFVIVPLFALANAGIVLSRDAIDAALASRITLGIVAGLVLGKLVGVTSATLLGIRLRVGRLPEGMRTKHIAGVGALAGIGFTVALFVSDLTFAGLPLEEAKMGVLGASVLAAVAGMAILLFVLREDSPVIVALVPDLMDRSRVSAALPDAHFARDPAGCADATVVLVDLARHGGDVAAVRAAAPGARIVAFGPHVDDEALAVARADGADAVLPRSRFFADVGAATHGGAPDA